MTIGSPRKWTNVRDAAIVTFSLIAAAFEITLGGARPSVLTFLSALLLSPVVIRADDARRGK